MLKTKTFSKCCFNTQPRFVVSFEELSLVWEVQPGVLLEILLADVLQLRTPVWVIVTFCFCWRLLFIKNKLIPARASGPQQEINVLIVVQYFPLCCSFGSRQGSPCQTSTKNATFSHASSIFPPHSVHKPHKLQLSFSSGGCWS